MCCQHLAYVQVPLVDTDQDESECRDTSDIWHERGTYLTVNNATLFIQFGLVIIIDPESFKEDLIFVRRYGSLVFLPRQ